MRSPRFWLVVQMLAVTLLAAAAGFLKPRTAHDTQSYTETAESGTREMLSSFRTLGYPLVLKAVKPLSPDYRIVPWVQLGAHLLAVFVFEIALRRFGASPWQALAASSGLLYTVLNDQSVAYLLTDSLGRTLAMATIALVFWVSAVPRRFLPWIGLALVLASTYHVRPAYLFLLPLVPCVGFVLLRIRSAWAGRPFRWLRHTLLLSAVSALPYVAFCLLRLIVVGHFGLVSFAGTNLAGVTIELLNHKTIENRLPQSWRPFARELLAERGRLGQESPLKPGGIDMNQWHRNYATNAWDIGFATAVRVYGNDPVLVNEKLSGISKALIVANKSIYLRFLAYNLRDGVGRVIGRGWVLQIVGLLALLAFFSRVMVCPSRPSTEAKARGWTNPGIMHALVLVAVMFAGAKLFLVAAVEVNVPRYIFAARVFLPAVFSLLACQEIKRIAHELGSNPGRTL